MEGQQIPIDAVKVLITETIKQVSEATNVRTEALEIRTEKQMDGMREAIDKMATTMSENSRENLAAQIETNRQLAKTNEQFVKWEERHHNQTKDINDLNDTQRAQGQEMREMHDEQIKDTLTRSVTWKVGAIVLTGVLGGAFTFAWWMIRTITQTMLTAAGG